MKTAFFAALLALTASSHADVVLLGGSDTAFSLQSTEFDNWLFIGASTDSMHPTDTLTTALHVGLDFPLVAFFRDSSRTYCAGLATLFHLYLFPVGSIFNVDNFYAAFAAYVAGTVGERFAWRLYPLYHVSAHLSDGAAVDYTVSRNKVSNEMLFATASYKFVAGLEAMVGGGWYYHTVGRHSLKGLIVGACSYERFVLPWLGLFGGLEGEIVLEDSRGRPGLGIDIGIRLAGQSDRRLDLSLWWYNRPHLGQYYTHNERAIGCKLGFGLGLVHMRREALLRRGLSQKPHPPHD